MAIRLIKNPDERNDPPRPLMEHLLALRDMVVFAGISWIIAVIICACFSNYIVRWLGKPMEQLWLERNRQALVETVGAAEAGAPAAEQVQAAGQSVTNPVSVAVVQAGQVQTAAAGQSVTNQATAAADRAVASPASAVPAEPPPLAVKGPVDGISIMMSVAFWAGTALGFPFIMFAILRFIFPALTRREKVVLLSILTVGTVFFVSGIVLAYQQTLPTMLAVFQAINEWMGLKSDMFFANDYIPVIIKTMFAFGLVFQLPLAIFVLGWFGIVSSDALRAKRRVAVVLSFLLSMFLTPPDPMSQIIMAVPLCLLYELSIWLIWLKEKSTLR